MCSLFILIEEDGNKVNGVGNKTEGHRLVPFGLFLF